MLKQIHACFNQKYFFLVSYNIFEKNTRLCFILYLLCFQREIVFITRVTIMILCVLHDKALLRSYFSCHFGALQDLSARPEICTFHPQKFQIPRKLSEQKLEQIHIKVTTNAREENWTLTARIQPGMEYTSNNGLEMFLEGFFKPGSNRTNTKLQDCKSSQNPGKLQNKC